MERNSSKHILKLEPTGFAERLDLEFERKRRAKADSHVPV